LGAFGELGADAGDAFVPDDLIKLEAAPLGLGALVVDGLLAGADTRIEDGSHFWSLSSGPFRSPLECRPLIACPPKPH
jgi:hypothetical protein